MKKKRFVRIGCLILLFAMSITVYAAEEDSAAPGVAAAQMESGMLIPVWFMPAVIAAAVLILLLILAVLRKKKGCAGKNRGAGKPLEMDG